MLIKAVYLMPFVKKQHQRITVWISRNYANSPVYPGLATIGIFLKKQQKNDFFRNKKIE